MDELLALMDENPTEEAPHESSSVDTLEQREASASSNNGTSTAQSSTTSSDRTLIDRPPAVAPSSQQTRAQVVVSIDDRLGIRMIKRKLSSADLTDLVACYPYHSTAALSAMSRAAWNRLLVEPAAVVSEATVSGKTTLATVGIVFTNSGTRISSNGRAFSVLTIGNLNTGPVVSVFMFGDAYSQHCTKCPPGTVIALVTPNLIPPKEDSRYNDCAVALSVADHRLLIPVAQARDYGVCKGTVSKRTAAADGQGQHFNHGHCKHYVDTRVSHYCAKHRRQQNVKNGPVNQGLSFMQQQRLEHRNQLGNKACTTKKMQAPTGFGARQNPALVATLQQQLDDAAGSRSGPKGQQSKAPMHMVKQVGATPLLEGRSVSVQEKRSGGPASSQKRTSTVGGSSRQPIRSSNPAGVGSRAVPDDWLTSMSSQSQQVTVKRKRVINKDCGGFDGKVAVPKPNKLFRATRPSFAQSRSAAVNRNALDQDKMASILEGQRLVAERQKENVGSQSGGTGKKLLSKSTPKRAPVPSHDSLKASLFEKIGSVDLDEILNAKSRFADEADAEAYARSRRIVTDLERREEQKNQVAAKKQKAIESAIQKEWDCATCNRTFKTRPAMCIRAKHNVSFKREVKQASTVMEERLKLDEKSVEDGGLRLGAGLEWDRRRQRFS